MSNAQLIEDAEYQAILDARNVIAKNMQKEEAVKHVTDLFNLMKQNGNVAYMLPESFLIARITLGEQEVDRLYKEIVKS